MIPGDEQHHDPGSREEDAFAGLFNRHVYAVYADCFRRSADWAAAEDLTSIVFLEAWRKRSAVDLAGVSFRSWLLGIATNVLRNQKRSRRRYRAALERLPRSSQTAILRTTFRSGSMRSDGCKPCWHRSAAYRAASRRCSFSRPQDLRVPRSATPSASPRRPCGRACSARVAWRSDAPGVCVAYAAGRTDGWARSCGRVPTPSGTEAGASEHLVVLLARAGSASDDGKAAIVGAVVPRVVAVELELADGRLLAAPTTVAPEAIDAPVRFFVVRPEIGSDRAGHVVRAVVMYADGRQPVERFVIDQPRGATAADKQKRRRSGASASELGRTC